MATNSTQQEILLMTGTSFSSRGWSKKDSPATDPATGDPLTEKEQLLEACWQGLLREILPELHEHTPEDKLLYIWKIREATSFLELELGEFPDGKDGYFSIDPYSFLGSLYYN
ncbi:MAG TPA: hypothetical protein VK563_10115 [Puia sp.]|nr:hypothetical protein [Puia sp.]